MLTNNYILNPNLPKVKVNAVIVDYRISAEINNALLKNGIEVIKTKQLNNLYDAVTGHPDMQIHHLGKNIFICEPTVYDYYNNKLKNASVYKGKNILNKKYPYDIAYNVAVVGKYVFHNLKYTESQILDYYKQNNYKIIDVKQGYSKCSVCPLTKNSLITSDKEIALKAQNNGIDALYVTADDVKLRGLSNGLIGGICGKIDSNLLALYGNINKLKCAKQFINFCEKYDVKILSLTDDIPEDFGSIIPLF